MAKKKPSRFPLRLALLIIPVAFLSLFMFGEVLGGDSSGLIHLIQIVPIAILGWLANRFHRVGGLILLSIGVLFLISYSLLSGFPVGTVIFVDLLVFVPMIASGWLYTSKP